METQKKDLVDGEEDVPSDFFDDFNKDDFMDGLSVIDSWDDEGGKRRGPRIDAEAVESVKDLRELIRDGKEQDGNEARSRSLRRRSTSQARLDDYIKPGSRRDPSKTNEAIKRDKEVKVKEYLAKHLQSSDDLRPPGTELDDFFDENKPKETKKELKVVLEERDGYASPPLEGATKYSSVRPRRRSPVRSPHRNQPSPRRSLRGHHNRSPHGFQSQRRYSPHRSYARNRRLSPRHRSRESHGRVWENRHRSPIRGSGSWRHSRSPQDRRPRRGSPSDRRSRHGSPLDRRSHHGSPLNRRSRNRSPLDHLLGRSPINRELQGMGNYPQAPGYVGHDPYQGPGPFLGPPMGAHPGPGPSPMPGYPYPQGPTYPTPAYSGPGPFDYGGPEIPGIRGPGMNPQPVAAPLINPVLAPALPGPHTPSMVPPPQSMVRPPNQPLPANSFQVTQPRKPYDALAQLVAEGKLSKEDYLKLAPNKGKSALMHGSNSAMDTKSRVAVLSRCNEAITKLGILRAPDRLLMSSMPDPESKAATKYCSPLKRQTPAEFMFTNASASGAGQQTKQLMDSIVTTLDLDAGSRFEKKQKKTTRDAAVQTSKPYCDVCEIRDSKEYFDASTRIEPEEFSASVHTQVLEQDLLNSRAMFNPSGSIADGAPISIAHMTPAQLVSQLAARAKTLKQSEPPLNQPYDYGRRPNYDYNRGGPPQYPNSYNNYNRY